MIDETIEFGEYPATPSLIDWMSQGFEALERTSYLHWRGLWRLVSVVDRAESGEIHKYVAHSAVDEYNRVHETAITYMEVLTLSTTYLPAFEGEWAVFTDSSRKLVLECKGASDIEEFSQATGILWAMVYDVNSEKVTVYRSPHIAHREGRRYLAVPPEIEGAIVQDLETETDNEPDWAKEREYERIYFDGRQLHR